MFVVHSDLHKRNW